MWQFKVCNVYSDHFAHSSLWVIHPLEAKLWKQKVEVCRFCQNIQLNPQVRAWLHFPTSKREKKSSLYVQVYELEDFLPSLQTGTWSSIHHLISLNNAAHRNLFSEQLTWGSCRGLEYSNKQLFLTGSGNNVRNVTHRIVCFSLPPH